MNGMFAAITMASRWPEADCRPVLAQLVKKVAFYNLACRNDINTKNLRGVLTEDLVLHLRRQLRLSASSDELFGHREGLEGLDLPMQRSDHRRVGSPQDVIGA